MASTITPSAAPENDTIVQYIVLRRDLWRDEGWQLGPILAQGCHAAIAAVCTFQDDKHTKAYVAADNLDHMHKVCQAEKLLVLGTVPLW
jgi:hypothetical protein